MIKCFVVIALVATAAMAVPISSPKLLRVPLTRMSQTARQAASVLRAPILGRLRRLFGRSGQLHHTRTGPDMQDLAGKVAVITGGARGMGLAIARALFQEGARVAIIDVDEKGASEAARELDEKYDS